jgi:hypothetical protein
MTINSFSSIGSFGTVVPWTVITSAVYSDPASAM